MQFQLCQSAYLEYLGQLANYGAQLFSSKKCGLQDCTDLTLRGITRKSESHKIFEANTLTSIANQKEN